MKGILAIILLFSYCSNLHAQYGYAFNRISTDDGIGLASNQVYTTYQDKKGFIWIGTANGLQRFDGSKFVRFINNQKDEHPLPIAELEAILQADSNSLWLLFPRKMEVGIFNTSTFKYQPITIIKENSLNKSNDIKLWKDSKGEVYITVAKNSILQYNKQKNAFVNNNRFKFPTGFTSSLSHFEDVQKQQFWFPCYDSGLVVFDVKTQQLYSKNFNPLKIPLLDKKSILPNTTEIFIDSKRRHWVFNWTGKHVKQCFDSLGNSLPDTVGIYSNKEYAELRKFFETKSGVLWFYGNNALFNYDNLQKKFYFYDNSNINQLLNIDYQEVYYMMEDHDGGVWLCTDNGLYFTSPSSGTFSIVDMQLRETEGAVEITDILELKSGDYWLSTWGRGVINLGKQFKPKFLSWEFTSAPKNSPQYIMYRQTWSMYQHTDGKVWVGCQGGKYIIYDTVIKQPSFLENAIFEGATIRYITGDKQGNVWFSTQKGHVIKYDGKDFSLVQKFKNIIAKILIDNEGLIWVPVNENGLYLLNNTGTKILHHYTDDKSNNSLFANTGNDIDQLNDSIIAFPTGALNFINKKTNKVQWLTFDDGLPSNTIYKVRKDGEGSLWMITSNGLCRYNPFTKKVTPYGKKDGITLARYTKEADYLCNEGFVMFGGANALMFFHPSIFKTPTPPNVILTDIKLFNNYLPVDSLTSTKKTIFNSQQNSFTFYFSSLSYVQREKLTYYYRLDGVDENWVISDGGFNATYSFLPPGKYKFNVYCENIDGVRSNEITSFTFIIKPPFWRTRWFLSCLLFVVALIVYIVHTVRVNKLLAVEKIRTRVARDLHDDMGSTLSTINILSAMAKSKMNSDAVKTAEFISKISDNSQRMMEAMDDIVWSIKPSNDTMQRVVARMREFATNVLEAKEIEIDFVVDEQVFDAKLNMEARRDFFLVFKEAVNNAAKYSNASIISVEIGTQQKQLYFKVTDDGKGFNTTTADNGNGLGNMHKRAEAMQGKLSINSTLQKGTTVILTVPIK